MTDLALVVYFSGLLTVAAPTIYCGLGLVEDRVLTPSRAALTGAILCFFWPVAIVIMLKTWGRK